MKGRLRNKAPPFELGVAMVRAFVYRIHSDLHSGVRCRRAGYRRPHIQIIRKNQTFLRTCAGGFLDSTEYVRIDQVLMTLENERAFSIYGIAAVRSAYHQNASGRPEDIVHSEIQWW